MHSIFKIGISRNEIRAYMVGFLKYSHNCIGCNYVAIHVYKAAMHEAHTYTYIYSCYCVYIYTYLYFSHNI